MNRGGRCRRAFGPDAFCAKRVGAERPSYGLGQRDQIVQTPTAMNATPATVFNTCGET